MLCCDWFKHTTIPQSFATAKNRSRSPTKVPHIGWQLADAGEYLSVASTVSRRIYIYIHPWLRRPVVSMPHSEKICSLRHYAWEAVAVKRSFTGNTYDIRLGCQHSGVNSGARRNRIGATVGSIKNATAGSRLKCSQLDIIRCSKSQCRSVSMACSQSVSSL